MSDCNSDDTPLSRKLWLKSVNAAVQSAAPIVMQFAFGQGGDSSVLKSKCGGDCECEPMMHRLATSVVGAVVETAVPFALLYLLEYYGGFLTGDDGVLGEESVGGPVGQMFQNMGFGVTADDFDEMADAMADMEEGDDE